MRYKDLTGNTYGRLSVVRYVGRTKRGGARWFCICACGGEKVADATNLNKGNTQSCGCLAIEQKRTAAKKRCHPFSKTRNPKEYNAWELMLRRCYDPKHPSFERYQKAGIAVCPTWRQSFPAFLSDMGACPENYTLDRIQNDGMYEPSNCRWATRKQQANNRRSNRLLTYDGLTLNIAQWTERLGWKKNVIISRLRYGWSVERTLTEPLRVHYCP